MPSLVEISKKASKLGQTGNELATLAAYIGAPPVAAYIRGGARKNRALARETDEMTEALRSGISRAKKRNKVAGRVAAGTAGVAALNAARPKGRKKTEPTETVLTKSVRAKVVDHSPLIVYGLTTAGTLGSALRVGRASAARLRNSKKALAQTQEQAARTRRRGMATAAGTAGAGAALVGSTQTRKRDR